MNLALASSVLGAGAGSAPTPPLDITTLPLTGLWRASYAGVPWTRTASAGPSGDSGRDMMTVTSADDPTIGPPIYGSLTSAVFDGTQTRLRNNLHTLDDFIATTAYRVALFFKPASLPSPAGAVYQNPGLLVDNQGVIGFVVDDTGVHAYHSSGGSFVIADSPAVPTLNDWNVADVVFDGSHLSVALNGTVGVVKNAGTLDAITSSTWILGANLFPSAWFDGEMGDVWTCNDPLSLVDSTYLLTYYADRYHQ